MDRQDDESSEESIQEDKAARPGSKRRTVAKAKMPEEEEAATAEYQKEIKSRNFSKKCGKSFISGKALGGKKDNSLESKMKRPAGENYCTECGKDFPSKKSLSGHMRWHSDGEWRGMHPRVDPKIESAEPSSELLDQEGDQDQIDLGPGPSPDVVDIGNSLKGWSVTGKRGRSVIVKPVVDVPVAAGLSSEEKQVLAVEVLTEWLQQKKNSTQVEDMSNNLLPSQLGTELESVHHFKKQKAQDDSIDDAESKIQNNDKGRDQKVAEDGKTPSIAEKYICNTCEKSFTSHQALGGHRSSHKKLTISIVNAMDEPKKVVKKNDKSYLCNICNKDFSSGQALGHHKRRFHSIAEEQNIRSTAAEEKVVDFDLNKMPDDDQEDDDEVGTQHSKNA